MRVSAFALSTFALSTLVAVGLGDSALAVPASPSSSPNAEHFSTRHDVVIPNAVEVEAIAPPSMLLTQFSPSQTQAEINAAGQVPYYQDYQGTPPPASQSPPAANLPSPPNALTAQNASAAPPATAQAAPVPIQPNATPIPLQQSPVAPLPAATPVELGDVAVTATDVQIIGADAELQQLVRNTIQTQPGGATTASRLQQDINAILDTGFFTDARVATSVQPEGVSVVFQVEPIVVRSLQLSGARVLPETVVNEIFAPQIGQPVNLAAFRQGVQQVNQWYADNGYTLAQVLTLIPSSNGVVTLDVAEGTVSQIDIRFVNEEGSTVDEDGQPIQGRTDEAFIRRQLQLQPGQAFDQSVAQQDLRNLYNLGLFDNADIALSGDPQNVVVTYSLTERLSRSFNVGGGYSDNAGLFGTLNYQDQNVGGVGDRLGGDLQIGTRDFQFGGNFTSPYRPSDPDRLGYSANAFRRRNTSSTFSDEVDLPNGDRVRLGRFGGGVAVNRPLGEWDADLGLNYTRISARDGDGNVFSEDEQGNPLTFSDTGIDDLTTLAFQASRDRRNNPVNPSEGSILSLSSEQSIPIGNGNILMNRLRANYVQYVPLDLLTSDTETNPENPEVLAFNLQGGTIIGDAPGYNAFDLGGINSVRGYGEGQVGTGRSYLLASAEYRFPIFSPLGGVVFADFATDLGSGDTVLGEPANVRDKPGTGFGYGLGVRVQSPLGLLRADYGFNDQGESSFHFGIGQRF
ncbi:BamA/TamA family outer membrane protein [Oculatella sp. LEGE 06141]|uniref:BamA/TamA family outer membrane protein n=1 Tax=Oculatella sp. LEGE 06141 TaxID=1828648 RepID=UPI00187EBF71|nr:BamA/TamA family outer membrane protein [Oculatella sp. LEGE 06141]MBE9181109.1 BamA/TamA family outer membrane protein [Oculatella sp. LEGE 06141]